MAKVTVSSARLKSMLANRNKNVKDLEGTLKMSVDLSVITTEDTEIEFSDIETLAKYFKKPWSYILIDEVETLPNKGQDNRTHSNQQVPVSADIIDELQVANFMLDTAIELFPDDKIKRPNFTLDTSMELSDVVTRIRSFLGINVTTQLATKDEYEALRMWAESIQAKGVYVSQRRLEDDTIRAFSLTKNNHAIMVVDTKDTPYARIFSILHEYCHILLKTAGICDLNEHSTIEHYCNEFAAKVLLPDELLRRELEGFNFSGNIDEDEEVIKDLSHRFRVSQAVLMIRLNGVGMLLDKSYSILETRRRTRKGKKQTSGGNYYRTKINAVGKKYAQNVFGALSEGAIGRTDASVLLGVGEYSVDRFKTELLNTSSRTAK
ncbi:MAG: ImmA/IrrE family metallo-endopeptidase [Candidatus Saccharibacteria bacterium]|nr:ImmA/IrrE family metallo-endopeptidase [Candidatus Saccharibacteria bacterium]